MTETQDYARARSPQVYRTATVWTEQDGVRTTRCLDCEETWEGPAGVDQPFCVTCTAGGEGDEPEAPSRLAGVLVLAVGIVGAGLMVRTFVGVLW